MMRTEKPLEKFESQEQLDEYVEYWKEVLQMQGWVVVARIARFDQVGEPKEAISGHVNMQITSRSAYITLLSPKDYPFDCVLRQCMEQTLVHELLHCKMSVVNQSSNYPGKYTEIMEHKLLDEMADSLLIARYDIPRDWFKNPYYCT